MVVIFVLPFKDSEVQMLDWEVLYILKFRKCWFQNLEDIRTYSCMHVCKISMFLVTPECKKEWGATVFG